ncbi:MAG: zinc-finger domain-containing protein [Candidatus Staskawiczbacteria bacterium]|nr:zinc-finger domain-containing protein [Candidatus Staskawiczbacteria bacterium]
MSLACTLKTKNKERKDNGLGRKYCLKVCGSGLKIRKVG